MKRSLVAAALIVGAILIFWQNVSSKRSPAPEGLWRSFSQSAFDEALAANMPVIVDVAADWCAPCLELERATFTDSHVRAKLAQFATFRMDTTDGASAEAQRFMESHAVEGVPTVLFFSASGTEIKALRLNGFESSEAFLARLRKLQAQAGGGA